MMYPVHPVQYPEVFTSRPQDIPLTELPTTTSTAGPTTVSIPAISLISVFGPGQPRSSRLQVVPVAPVVSSSKMTTVSSALKFSIISTSTQTSGPLLEHTTPHAVDTFAQHEELQPVLGLEQTEQTLSEAKTGDTKSTTISLPIISTTVGAGKEVVATTSSEDLMKIPVTDMTDGSPGPTTQQIQEDESKFQEVTTAGDPGSIITDRQMTTSSVAV